MSDSAPQSTDVRVGVCDHCQHVTTPPPQFCPQCLGEIISVESLSKGFVYSSTVVRHGVKDIALPYGLAYIDLNADVRIVARYSVNDGALQIGSSVQVAQKLNESGTPVFTATPPGLKGTIS